MDRQVPLPHVHLGVRCGMCGDEFDIIVNTSDWEAYQARQSYIQDLFPYLTPAERELMISRTCGPCFNKLFPPED